MRVGQAFPSDWLMVEDIGNRDVTVTIEEVALKKVGRDNQYVVYFQGKRKGLVIYQRQARQIANALGDDEMDNWPGHQITLYAGVSANGKAIICVREGSAVDTSRHETRAAAAAPGGRSPVREVLSQREIVEPLNDDDIPF